MNRLCPRCGELNDHDSGTCKECGFSINKIDAKTREEGIPADLKTLLVGTDKVKILSCVECDYPLRKDSENCPNCGLKIIANKANSDKSVSPKKGEKTIESIKVKEITKEDKSKTIIQNYKSIRDDQFTMDTSGPETVLQSNLTSTEEPILVAESDVLSAPLIRLSSISLNGEDGCNDINIDTANAHLGRDDIDSNDNTISKKHIRIFREDDNWFIENQASNKATFYMVDGHRPIKNGDLILVGNSKFFRIEIL